MASKFSAVHQRCFEIDTTKPKRKTFSPKASTGITYKTEPKQKNASPKHSTAIRCKKSKKATAYAKSTEGFVATRPLLPKTMQEKATAKSKMPRLVQAVHQKPPKMYFQKGAAANEFPIDRHSRFAIQKKLEEQRWRKAGWQQSKPRFRRPPASWSSPIVSPRPRRGFSGAIHREKRKDGRTVVLPLIGAGLPNVANKRHSPHFSNCFLSRLRHRHRRHQANRATSESNSSASASSSRAKAFQLEQNEDGKWHMVQEVKRILRSETEGQDLSRTAQLEKMVENLPLEMLASILAVQNQM